MWGQQLDTFIQPGGPDVRDGVGTDDIGEARYTHQPGVCLRRGDEYVGDDGGGGDALPLQGDSVVQTARRAAPSIPNPCDNQVRVAV